MNIKFLPLLILPFLIVSSAMADDWVHSPHSPYDIDVIYEQEAAPYIKHVEDKWAIYQLSKDSWKKIERITTATYKTKNLKMNLHLGLNDLKPSIRSKIQYKGRTVHLVFDFEN